MTVTRTRCCTCLLVPLLLFSWPARAAVSEPWPHEHSDIAPDPRITWGRLDNGLRYAVRQNHEPQGRVYLTLEVHAGSLNERDDQSGYAHFVEHMLFNGTRRYPGTTLVEQLQRDGLEFGADISAFTTYDYTFYNLDLPQNTPERIRHGIDVLRDFADGATFDKTRLKSEAGVIESERRTRETTATHVAEQIDAYLFPDSRLPHRLPIGTTDSVRKATAAGLREFYQTWYRPSRMTIIAVGDADPAVLVQLIRDEFNTLQPAVPAEPPEPDPGSFAVADGVAANFFQCGREGGVSSMMYCLSPPHAGGDTAERRRRQVEEAAGFWILNQRLQDLVSASPAELGQAQASWQDYRRNARFSLVRVDTLAGLWRRGLRTGEQELRRALTHGFTGEEVREQVGRFRNYYTEIIRNDPTFSSTTIAQTIRYSLETDLVCSSPQTNWDVLSDTVGQLTPENCLKQFQAIWAPANRRLVVIGPRPVQIAGPEILSAYQVSQVGNVRAKEEEPPVQFDYTVFGRPGEIRKRQHVDSIDTESVEFTNHVRLNIKHTDFEAGRVYFRARLGQGLAAQPLSMPGLGLLAASFFTQGGLMRHDQKELERIMAGTTLSLTFNVEENACYFSGVANRDSLEMLLQLFTAYLTDPGFRFSAYQHAGSQMQAYYADLAHDPFNFLHAIAPLRLSGNNSRYGVPPREQTLARSSQQIQDWLRPILAGGELEIGLVGDLDPDKALASAARTVGTLPYRYPNPSPDPKYQPAFPAKPLNETWRIDTPQSKAVVQLSWPGTDEADYHRDRKIWLLAEILNDRVRVKLREDMGITYTPVVSSWGSTVWPGYGYLQIEVVSAPRQADEVARLVRGIASDLVVHGITPDEFDRARQPRLSAIAQDLRDNSYWLNYVLCQLQASPGVADVPLSRKSDYQNMRIEDIETVARACLGSGRVCTFIVRPK